MRIPYQSNLCILNLIGVQTVAWVGMIIGLNVRFCCYGYIAGESVLAVSGEVLYRSGPVDVSITLRVVVHLVIAAGDCDKRLILENAW